MSNDNALIPFDELQTLLPARYDDKVFDSMAASSSFLPYLTLGGLTTKFVGSRELGLGNYGVVTSKKCTDIGDSVDVIVLQWLPLAMRTGGETLMSLTDPSDLEFKKIVDEADIKDSGCMFGPCFLLYIPKTEQFVTYFMSSKTARNEAPNLKGLMGKGATLKSHLIKPKASRHQWYGPLITPCSKTLEVPAPEAIRDAGLKFGQVSVSDVETVEENGRAL